MAEKKQSNDWKDRMPRAARVPRRAENNENDPSQAYTDRSGPRGNHTSRDVDGTRPSVNHAVRASTGDHTDLRSGRSSATNAGDTGWRLNVPSGARLATPSGDGKKSPAKSTSTEVARYTKNLPKAAQLPTRPTPKDSSKNPEGAAALARVEKREAKPVDCRAKPVNGGATGWAGCIPNGARFPKSNIQDDHSKESEEIHDDQKPTSKGGRNLQKVFSNMTINVKSPATGEGACGGQGLPTRARFPKPREDVEMPTPTVKLRLDKKEATKQPLGPRLVSKQTKKDEIDKLPNFKVSDDTVKDKDLKKRVASLSVKGEGPFKEQLNEILDNLEEELEMAGFDWYRINSGSSFEKLKISRPNEYDVMFVLDNLRTRVVYSPKTEVNEKSYCKLKVLGDKADLKELVVCGLTDSRFISPKLFIEYFRRQVKKAVGGLKSRDLKIIIKNWNGRSPAVTLDVRSGRDVNFSVDLVPAVRIFEWPKPAQPFVSRRRSSWLNPSVIEKFRNPAESQIFPLAVPKIHGSEIDKDPDQCELFRISFSEQEKQILLYADGIHNNGDVDRCQEPKKTCRKNVLRLIKNDLEECPDNIIHRPSGHKGNVKVICSFHIKTILLHLYDELADIDMWVDALLRCRYVDALRRVVDSLRSAKLMHYFIAEENLLSVGLNNVSTAVYDQHKRRLVNYFEALLTEWS